MLLYIGPGVGVATVVMVAIILALIFASLVVVAIRPIKRLIKSIKNKFSGSN